jgi:hypothetical protein
MSSQGKQYAEACLGGCGFFGNSAMQNYCSVCFKKFVPNAENILKQITQSKELVHKEETINNNKEINDHNNTGTNSNCKDKNIENNDSNSQNTDKIVGDNIKEQKKKIRCRECNKKLALAQQFECKCGSMFCSIHRYADCHNCSFDYQRTHQEKLESLNPVVAPSKVQQI